MAAFSTYLRRLRPADFVRWIRQGSAYYGRGLYRQLMHKDIFLWSQAIAFKVLITVVPVIILATGVLGQVLEREKPFETVSRFIRNFLPPDTSNDLINVLRQLSSAGDFYTIVGVLGLLFSAVSLFTTLRTAVGNVFQEEWHEERSLLGGYLFDLRMVGQVGLLFILTFGLTLAMQTLNNAGFEFIEKVGLDYVWIREGWRRAIKTVGLILPFFLSMAMFFQLLYFVPKPHPPRRSVFVGSLFTAVLWEAAKSGFALYATSIGRFDRYNGPGDGGTGGYLGNTFGLIIAFVFWVYFSGIVLLLGALVTLLHEKKQRLRPEAAPLPAPETAGTSEAAARPETAPPPLPAASEAQDGDAPETPTLDEAPDAAPPAEATPEAPPESHAEDAPNGNGRTDAPGAETPPQKPPQALSPQDNP